MDKIEFIEVNGKELPLAMFPADIQNQVATFEIVRGEYNKSVVLTQSLSDYMQRISGQVQAMANEHMESLTSKKEPEVAAPPYVIVDKETNEPIVVDDAE